MRCVNQPKAALLAASLAAVMHGACAQAQTFLPAERHNVVSFSSTVQQEVTHDMLTLTLQATRSGAVAAEVQADLKRALDGALTQARFAAKPGDMDVRTGQFSIQPMYSNSGKINAWQGVAQLVLQGRDMARIAQTAGKLNQLNIVNVAYGLSRETQQQYQTEMVNQAIEAFRARAQQMAKAFGFAHYTLGEVSVQTGDAGYQMRPMMMKSAMMADGAEAAVPIEPGKGEINVTVSGHVILQP
jgi:predicted secreted protein